MTSAKKYNSRRSANAKIYEDLWGRHKIGLNRCRKSTSYTMSLST